MIHRLRIDPHSELFERDRKAKSFLVSVASGFVFVSGQPPFDPIPARLRASREQQAERVMAQLKNCREVAGATGG